MIPPRLVRAFSARASRFRVLFVAGAIPFGPLSLGRAKRVDEIQLLRFSVPKLGAAPSLLAPPPSTRVRGQGRRSFPGLGTSWTPYRPSLDLERRSGVHGIEGRKQTAAQDRGKLLFVCYRGGITTRDETLPTDSRFERGRGGGGTSAGAPSLFFFGTRTRESQP